MAEPRNRVVQVRRFGGPDGLEVVDAPLPMAGRGEVRVRVLASSVVYTDVVIRRPAVPTNDFSPAPSSSAMTSSGKSISSGRP